MWWVLHLAYTLNDKEEVAPLFNQKTYEEKLEHYDELEEKESQFWNEVFKKFAYFISFWYMGKISTQEDFRKAEKFYSPIQEEIKTQEESKEVKTSDNP